MSLPRLRNDVAVITGASSGVGRAIARAFAEQGARVALVARNVDELQAVARELRERGTPSMLLALDVADSKAIDEAINRILAEWGKIDLWVNNAVVTVAPVTKGNPEEHQPAIQVNYGEHVHGTRAALRHMRPRNRGVILQIGSALAVRSVPQHSAYCASKAAIRSFTDSLRSALIREGSAIAVTMLHLPVADTPRSEIVHSRLSQHSEPISPSYQPEVIAQAAVYAALHHKGAPSPVTRAPKTRSRIAPIPRARSHRRSTRPVVFAVLGLSAAALAFGPVRRWALDHARSAGRTR